MQDLWRLPAADLAVLVKSRQVSAKEAPARSMDDDMKGTALGFETKRIHTGPDAIAPDGSEVRVLCQLSRGGLAIFSLPPNTVSKAVAHRTVEEVWYILSGKGRMWRKLADQEKIAELGPGTSLTIPTGTHFQFRCDGPEPLNAIGATEAMALSDRIALYRMSRLITLIHSLPKR